MRISPSDAVLLLRREQVVGLPTETVYGLAGLAASSHAVEEIFRLKGRPKDNPMIVHVASYEQLFSVVVTLPPETEELCKEFWPGPLTLVLPAKDEVLAIVRGGRSTLGVRMPAHDSSLSILEQVGPVAMPSANLSGRPSATEALHVEEDFGSAFPVVDGGACFRGVESTILLYSEGKWVVGREGAYPAELFTPLLGYEPTKVMHGKADKPLCPGSCYRHYAPKATLIPITSFSEEMGGALLGFSNRKYPAYMTPLLLFGRDDNPSECLQRLYWLLRSVDHRGLFQAYIDLDFPSVGLWATLRERLLRASDLSEQSGTYVRE